MRPLTARLEDGYCSITVANHRLITVIRIVAKSYTHLWKDFANKLRLVLHAYKSFFSGIVCRSCATQTNRAKRYASHCTSAPPQRQTHNSEKFVARSVLCLSSLSSTRTATRTRYTAVLYWIGSTSSAWAGSCCNSMSSSVIMPLLNSDAPQCEMPPYTFR